MNSLTIDVEDWYHILDSRATPPMEQWAAMEPRIDANMERILGLLVTLRAKATFFWLGWIAERNESLVRRCVEEGHEIASHGYAHLLPYEAGRDLFRADIIRAKAVLEDISGRGVIGFRAPGFGILRTTPWALDTIRETGHLYDASVFPARHGHGGQAGALRMPHFIETQYGSLFEIPVSVAEVLGWRFSLFGGGYLRLAPGAAVNWGAARLQAEGRPLVVYVHPRDIDPDQPRLPLPLLRRFKCYINLHTTFDKLKGLCQNYHFGTMRDLMNAYVSSVPRETGTDQAPLKTHPDPKLRHPVG